MEGNTVRVLVKAYDNGCDLFCCCLVGADVSDEVRVECAVRAREERCVLISLR